MTPRRDELPSGYGLVEPDWEWTGIELGYWATAELFRENLRDSTLGDGGATLRRYFVTSRLGPGALYWR